jgi:hypothetical protein
MNTLFLLAALLAAGKVGAVPARAAVPDELDRLVTRAKSLVQDLSDCEVVILRDPRDLLPQLLRRGYSRQAALTTVAEVRHFAEFTVDHHFPIFVNAGSPHTQRILRSWQKGVFPEEAARVMASDLYHEYLHAAKGQEECDAIRGHLTLLKRWRDEGLLHIAGPYIAAKTSELRRMGCQPE